MKLMQRLCSAVAAGALVLSLAACSESTVDMTALVNTSLAQKGSPYTVTAASATNETVSLISEALETYDLYRTSLINTAELESNLYAEEAEAAEEAESFTEMLFASSPAYIAERVNKAKKANRETCKNFEQSLQSFNDRGIGKAYALTGAEIPTGVYDDQAVADYVAGLITGNAEIYISSPLELPLLDDAAGTYTGASTSMRYVYINYAE